MASLTKLTEQQIASALESLTGWSVVNGKLHREYKFPDFVHAFGFMATAAVAIEAGGHHPEWFNVYNRVVVDLTTHDAGGITVNDTELAAKLDDFARKLEG
jgi:4a-hydroxytetrahydrobiopterin dehydratase